MKAKFIVRCLHRQLPESLVPISHWPFGASSRQQTAAKHGETSRFAARKSRFPLYFINFHDAVIRFHCVRGMETLTSQYLALAKYPEGIVDVKCDPCKVCASAAKQVTTLAPESKLHVVVEVASRWTHAGMYTNYLGVWYNTY